MPRQRDPRGPTRRPDRGLRPVQDVVGRIRFDAALDVAGFTVGYEERFAGVREAPLADFIGAGEIPWHRIWFIKAGTLVVWDRRERVDLIFGSGDSPAADLPAVQRACVQAPPRAPEPAARRGRAGPAEFVAQPSYRFDPARGAWVAGEAAPGLVAVAVEALQVVTYNVLFDLHEAAQIYSERRRAACLELLRARDADLLALQEVTPQLWSELLAAPWVQARYHVSTGPDAAGLVPYGQALLSRWPLALELHAFSAQKRLLIGRMALGGRPLTVAAVHLTSNQKDGASDKRAEQLAVLGERLARDPGDAIVLGDFNFGDGEENAQIAGMGLVDAWTAVHPHHPGFTFDPVANPLATLMSRTGRAARYDRVLVRAPTQALVAIDVTMFGDRAFATRDGQALFASDHFGLCGLLQVAATRVDAVARAALAAATPVHHSALIVAPPERLWRAIDAIRAAHDPSHGRWMPHINLIYGFVDEALFTAAAPAIAAAIAGLAPFRVRLGELRRFDHRGSTTVWLAPVSEPPGALVALQATLAALFPGCDEQRARAAAGYTPHLTIARLTGSEAQIAAQIAGWQAQWRPLEFIVDAVLLISRRQDEPFVVRHALPLGAGVGPGVELGAMAGGGGGETSGVEPVSGGGEIAGVGPGDRSVVAAGPSSVERPGVAASPPWAALPSQRHADAVAAVAAACAAALSIATPCLHVVGSARLGVAVPESDLDLVCAGPAEVERETLFAAVREQLAAQGLLAGAREAGSAGVAVLRCRIGELAVDLQYAGLPAGLRGRDLATLDAAALSGLDATSRRAALGVVDADALVRLVAGRIAVATFREFLRQVRAWARARQLDVGAWGLLGGYTWALLAAWVIDDGAAGAADPEALLRRFFAVFAAWEAGRPVAFGGTTPAPASRRAPWPIYTPTPPAFNSARSLTRSTLALLQAELQRGRAVMTGAVDEPLGAAVAAAGQRRVVLTLRGDDATALAEGAGWLDGQVLGLLLALEDRGARVRPYPRAVHGAAGCEQAIGVEGGGSAQLLAAAQRFADDFRGWIGRPPGVTLTATLVHR